MSRLLGQREMATSKSPILCRHRGWNSSAPEDASESGSPPSPSVNVGQLDHWGQRQECRSPPSSRHGHGSSRLLGMLARGGRGTAGPQQRSAEAFNRHVTAISILAITCGLLFVINLGTLRAHYAVSPQHAPVGCTGPCAQQSVKFYNFIGPLPRNNPEGIRKAGSIYGFFHLRLNCPAAPAYQPVTLFNSSEVPGPYEKQQSTSIQTGERLHLLIGILSSCKAVGNRDAVRDTWLRLRVATEFTWRAVFIVSETCKVDLQREQDKHEDLLFVPVKDSYFTLTPKVLHFFDYAHKMGAEYAMKTDDDSYVFTDRVLDELHNMGKLEQDNNQCLYWGQANRLPDGKKYKSSGLAVPLHKWYIPKTQYMMSLDGTRYMQGGGYILSKDLVARVAERTHDPPGYLPEDAILSTVIGQEHVERCLCSDSRLVKQAYDFQHIDLFKSTTQDCEVSDIAYRVLNVHGIHKSDDMHKFHRLAMEPLQHCDMNGRVFRGREHQQIWGLSVLPKREKPIYSRTSGLWKKLQNKKKRHYNDQELVPLAILMGDLEKEKELPWCVRMDWASQIIDLLRKMSDQKTLMCNIVRSNFFINATSLEVFVDQGDVLLNYTNETRLKAGDWCFSDELCHTCFLAPSREFLDDGKCDQETHKCIGYDGVSQAKVVVTRVLQPLFHKMVVPAVPKRKFLPQVAKTFEDVFIKRHPFEPKSDDWIVEKLQTEWKSLLGIYGARHDVCMGRHASTVSEFLKRLIRQRHEAALNAALGNLEIPDSTPDTSEGQGDGDAEEEDPREDLSREQ